MIWNIIICSHLFFVIWYFYQFLCALIEVKQFSFKEKNFDLIKKLNLLYVIKFDSCPETSLSYYRCSKGYRFLIVDFPNTLCMLGLFSTLSTSFQKAFSVFRSIYFADGWRRLMSPPYTILIEPLNNVWWKQSLCLLKIDPRYIFPI